MTLNRGTLFPPELIPGLINGVKGHSSIAVLSAKEPIPFDGKTSFVFTMDSEVDVVAESGAKSHGGVSLAPKTIVPIKVEYGARFSREMWLSSEENQMDILKSFSEGFAKKVARGLDLMVFHGINPRSGAASAVIGTKHFDAAVTQRVNYNSNDPDANIESAIEVVQGAGGEATGLAMAPTFSAALAKLKVNGVKVYPELAWGANPGSLNGLKIDINKTVSDFGNDKAIVGDFANALNWGFSKEIPLTIIEAGDPDNSGKDLNGYNQIYLRSEIFVGWGILNEAAFARIVTPEVVALTLAQVGGTTGTTDSTAISLTFDKDIIGLTADHITLADGTGKATKGALTGSGKVYSLAITDVSEGTVAVTVAGLGGYTFPAAQNVTVFSN